jgi:hypothetical protein
MTVWVKRSIANDGDDHTIYVYYGNPNAGRADDGDATFVFFDDFEGTTINTNKWNTTGVTGYSVSGGALVITYNEVGGGNLLTTRNPIGINSFRLIYRIQCTDGRVNFYCSQSPIKRASGGGNWYQALIPWYYSSSSKGSYIDWFIDGALQGIVYGNNTYINNYSGIMKVQYVSATEQHVWLTTSDGTVIFDNVLLNKFSVTNTYLSLSKDCSTPTYFYYLAVANFVLPEPTVSVGEEEQYGG